MDDESHRQREADTRPARTLYTRADWDDAVDEGTLKPQDVLDRLTRILLQAFGVEGSAAYDEDGFFLSLTAEGLRLEGGITLQVNTADHPPPHVHVLRPGMKEKLRINLETGEFMDALPSGLSAKKSRGLQEAVRESYAVLARWWDKAHT